MDTPAGIGEQFDRIFKGQAEGPVGMGLTGRPASRRHPAFIETARVVLERFRIGYIFSSVGCGMGCSFCHATTYMPKREEIPLEEIERKLDLYVQEGVRGVLLFEATLKCAPHGRKVVDLISERGLPFWFECCADDIEGEVAQLVGKGLFGICMGIESFRDEDLERSRKRESTCQTMSVIEELKENEVWFMTTYLFGWESDTPESIERDLERISKLEIPYFQSMVITPFPGTIIWREWQDIIFDHEWSHYDHQHLVFRHPHLSPEDADHALTRCYELLTAEKVATTPSAWEAKFGNYSVR